MDALLPILIVLYVISSVVSAVMKAGQKGKTQPQSRPSVPRSQGAKPGETPAQTKPQSRPDVVVVEPSGSMGVPTMIWEEEEQIHEAPPDSKEERESESDTWRDHDEAWETRQSLANLSRDDWDDEIDEEQRWERPAAAAAIPQAQRRRHPVFYSPNRRRLVEGVIWGEVLKKPRSQRPWPNR